MNPTERSITLLLDAYAAAVLAKNVDAFVALYEPDVRVFDLWGRWSYDGIDAWRGMASGWFGSLGTDRVVVTFDDVQARSAGDLAIVHAFVAYSGFGSGGPTNAMTNRLTWSLRRGSDRWRIVHEHTSAPVDPDTMKALLQR